MMLWSMVSPSTSVYDWHVWTALVLTGAQPRWQLRVRRRRAGDVGRVRSRQFDGVSASASQTVAAQARLASFQVAELTSSQARARSCVRTAAGTTVPVMFAW